VETLIVWESLEVNRYVLKNNSTGEEKILHLTKEQEADAKHFVENGVELEVVDKISLLEWFANNYKKFGATLEFITNKSQEGAQFCKGFGGIGGILRYRVDFQAGEVIQDTGDSDSDDVEDDLEAYF